MTDINTIDVQGRTLTAFFDTRQAADTAISDLEAAGIPRQQIRRVDGDAAGTAPGGTAAGGNAAGGGGTGFLASLKDLFLPEEDRYGYAEGLRRGGYFVSVRADEANYTRVLDILDRDGAVDMDEREAAWRQEGWTGYAREADVRTSTAPVVAAAGTAAAVGTATGTVRAGGERVAAAFDARGASAGTEYIPVVEERLTVGKRDVSHGRVRLRSYVVETPVEEQVSLHDETVRVERRRVDRPATAADEALFTEKTIELEERAEEAVVAKEVRVVEEIALRKEAVDRTETVRDTVRSTKVEVEDSRTGAALGGAAAWTVDQIRAGLEVVGSDGTPVGTVDRVEGGRIKLKKGDPASGGQHHYLLQDAVRSVAGKVVLAVTAAEARARWTTA